MDTGKLKMASALRWVFAMILGAALALVLAVTANSTQAFADDGSSAPAASGTDETQVDNGSGDQSASSIQSSSADLRSASEAYNTTIYGDDGSDEMYIEVFPYVDPIDSIVSPEEFNSYVTPNPEGGSQIPEGTPPPYIENTDSMEVFVVSEVGGAVDLALMINQIRIDNTVFDQEVVLPGASTAGDVLISWYAGESPFRQGVYYSNPEYHQSAGSTGGEGDEAGQSLPQYEGVQISALSYQWKNIQDHTDAYWLANRVYCEPASREETNSFNLAWGCEMSGWSGQTYFDRPFQAGQVVTLVAQATYVMEVEHPTADPSVIEVETILCASKPVYFRIFIRPAEVATINIEAEDDSGNVVNLREGGKFIIGLYKHYGDGKLAPCSGSYEYDCATAGRYTLNVQHVTGKYESYSEEFELTEAEILAAQSGSVITKKVTLTAIPDPVLYSVTFVDEDGSTVLLASQSYNEGTIGSLVATPQTKPVKAETDDYKYYFDKWEIVELGGCKVDTPVSVTRDMTYKAVYRAVPKKNVSTVTKVYASGGLFRKLKPAEVLSYEMSGGELAGSEKESAVTNASSWIGDNSVIGVFRVDLVQNNVDGSTKTLTEGVGDMTLNFSVSGVADGTKVKAIQIHKTYYDNGEVKSVELIEHKGLTVVGGQVQLTLDDKLSDFVITTDNDPDDSTQGGDSGSEGSGAEDSGTAESGSGASEGNAKDSVESADAPTKAAASTGGKLTASDASTASSSAASEMMPATDDANTTTPIVLFAALAALAILALANRKQQVQR